MPLPFYVCTFTRSNDTYNCKFLPESKKGKALGLFFEMVSRQVSLVESIKQIKEGALSLEDKLLLIKDQDNIKIFLKDTDVVHNNEDLLEFGHSELNNLLYLWTNYQKAVYSVITVSIIDRACVLYGFYEELYQSNRILEKKNVVHRIKDICNTAYTLDNKKGEQIEAMLVDYLCKYPFDIDMWVGLTNLEHTMPWQDSYRIYNYLENALIFDANNVQVLLLLAFQEYLHRGQVTEQTMYRLDSLKNIDFHSNSMIFYIKALSLMDRASAQYEKYLLRSIEFYDKDVNNYEDLAEHYYDKGEYVRALIYYKNALKNVQKVYVENDSSHGEDILNINDFFDYYYCGTSKTEYFKKKLEQKITELEKSTSSVVN